MKIKTLTQIGVISVFLIGITSNALCQDYPTIEVVDVSAQTALVLKAEVKSTEVGSKIGEMYGNLFTYINSNNLQMVGNPFAVYYSYDPQGNTSFEAACPVINGTKGNDSILYKEFPAMKVVCTIYQGTYESMEPVYIKLMDYMKINNLKSTGPSWEVYLTDPSTIKDPNENRTMIYFPVE